MKIQKNIAEIARKTLLNEANAIENLVNYIDADFEACVDEILNTSGRVVVTGIGKSAIIAQKMVATFNSTGTPSLFLHAADAIHGDLGMIQENDFVICISKSGNTPEIKVLVPLLKRRGSKMAVMVSNIDSYLAKNADYVLNITIDREACPNNLAPTTSTTATLAMGDALAVCLLEARDFTSEDFAKYHPGGSLGKKLYLKVSDVYPNNELPTVLPDVSVDEAILEISSKRLGATAVVDEEHKLVGVITDGDLRRMLKGQGNITTLKAKDIMTKNPKVVDQGDFAVKALNLMQESNITQLIVVNKENVVVGFIHLHDLLKEGLV